MKITKHRLDGAEQVACPNMDERSGDKITLIVIHNISLPAGHFGSSCIRKLFCNELDTATHVDFGDLLEMRVSSHLFVRRDGSVLQFVPFNKRAWHAGESIFNGQSGCNDFSIGIELEGTDDSGFREVQYAKLAKITDQLLAQYHIPPDNIVGHSDIAPGRKTDPGPQFDWIKFRKSLRTV
jgi:AmpD protein